jgi:hypothetical protein
MASRRVLKIPDTAVTDEVRARLGRAERAVDRTFTTSDSARLDQLHDLLARVSLS